MILDEANKLYERLLKYLTNSIIDNTVGASSNSTLSLPLPSSTFPNRSNQIIYTEKKSQKFIMIVKAISLIELILGLVYFAIFNFVVILLK